MITVWLVQARLCASKLNMYYSLFRFMFLPPSICLSLCPSVLLSLCPSLCLTSLISSLACCSLSGLLVNCSLASASRFLCRSNWLSCHFCHVFIRWSNTPCINTHVSIHTNSNINTVTILVSLIHHHFF